VQHGSADTVVRAMNFNSLQSPLLANSNVANSFPCEFHSLQIHMVANFGAFP